MKELAVLLLLKLFAHELGCILSGVGNSSDDELSSGAGVTLHDR